MYVHSSPSMLVQYQGVVLSHNASHMQLRQSAAIKRLHVTVLVILMWLKSALLAWAVRHTCVTRHTALLQQFAIVHCTHKLRYSYLLCSYSTLPRAIHLHYACSSTMLTQLCTLLSTSPCSTMRYYACTYTTSTVLYGVYPALTAASCACS
jgi:hypothetical protein